MRNLALLLVLLASCDGSDATYAAATNTFPASPNAAPTSVYKVWYRTALFTEAITPGNDTPVHVVAPGGDVAYAVLAPGWNADDPDAGAPPSLVGVMTTGGIYAKKGDIARIELGPTTVRGACVGQPLLTKDEYDVVRDRIFPGEDLPPFESACDGGAADAGRD
jgi:hypothetical protein